MSRERWFGVRILVEEENDGAAFLRDPQDDGALLAYGWPMLTKEQADVAEDFFHEETEREEIGKISGDDVYIFTVSCDGSMSLTLRHEGTGRTKTMELVRGGLL